MLLQYSESIAWSVLTTNSKRHDSREVIGEEIIIVIEGGREERAREEEGRERE